MARQQRVFIDTNELFPFSIMDLMLTLAEQQLYRWVWTDVLLDEWEHVIVREQQRSAASARSITATIRTFFGPDRLDASQYQHLIDASLSPDPDDRDHAAACLSGRIDVLITRNRKDFPIQQLADAGVRTMTADTFLVELAELRPTEVVEAVGLLADRKRNPPRSRSDVADSIVNGGAPRFGEILRQLLSL